LHELQSLAANIEPGDVELLEAAAGVPEYGQTRLQKLSGERSRMKTKHTPGPWKVQKPRGRQHAIDRQWEIVFPCKGGGEQVVVGEHTGIDCLTEANAERIVQCCDSHDALLAALREFVRQYEGNGHDERELRPEMKLARAALAQLDQTTKRKNQTP